jgi:multidrug efflux pump subunit AcrA (membrane-fusion protein)
LIHDIRKKKNMNAQHRQTLKIKLLILLVGTALLISGCSVVASFQDPAEPTPVPVAPESAAGVIAEGNLVPATYLYLGFPMGGRVQEILVEKGDQVAAGDLLVSLGDREQAQAALVGAQLELESAQQTLDSLNENADLTSVQARQALIEAIERVNSAQVAWDAVDTDAFQEDIDDARQDVLDAEQDVEDAQEEFDKRADLSEDNPTYVRYEQELEDAQDALNQAIRELDSLVNQRDMAEANLLAAQALLQRARTDYDSTRDGPDPDQLRLTEKRLENAQAQVQAAQLGLDNMDLVAPFAGSIVDINIKPGELVGNDTWAILIADLSQWYVETNDLTELEVVEIEVGQSVTLLPDSLPDVVLSGEVTEISDVFSTLTGDILYKVRILVEEGDPLLRWGMTFEVDF